MAVAILFVFWCMHPSMAFLVAFCRVVVTALLGMRFFELFLLLVLGVLCLLDLDVDRELVGGNVASWRLGRTAREEAGIQYVCSLPRGELARVLHTVLEARQGSDRGLNVACARGACLAACAVHGLNTLGDDDNERGADQHAGAEQGDDAQLARGQGKGEGEDAGEEGAASVNRRAEGRPPPRSRER